MKSVETQLGKERKIRQKIANHLIIRQLMHIHILDCPLQVCRKDGSEKRKVLVSACFVSGLRQLGWKVAWDEGQPSLLRKGAGGFTELFHPCSLSSVL